MDSSLTPFFDPQGIVVIGASTKPEKLGYGVARNLLKGGYEGAIHLVNPKDGTLFGIPMQRSVAEVPDPVDLAVVIVPAAVAPQTLREVGQRGIHAAILTSSGFRETGPQGAALEEELLEVCRAFGIRLIGPNCIGLLDTHLPLDTTFLAPPPPPSGDIAFLSHSGAFCAAIIDWSRWQGFGFSRLISLGNQADVTETDLLAHIASDPHTRSIVLYLEGLKDGRRFLQEAARVTPRKPIVALKVGRFESGQKAAASHTGALAGAEAAFDAAFEKAGVLRALTVEEAFDWAQALAACRLPRGRRMAVLTNAGGPGVIAADSLEDHGLSLAALDPATIRALQELLPPAASPHNPVDMLASASPADYANCLRLLLDDPQVDGVLLVLPPPPIYPAEEVADVLIPLIRAADKPVLVALMGAHLVQTAARHFERSHIPTFPFPERAAATLARLAERAEFLEKPKAESQPAIQVDAGAAAAILETTPRGAWLEAEAVNQLMNAYGIPTAPVKLAHSADEAAVLAEELGFPLVVKVASPNIPHKSDVGGVVLGVDSPESAATAFRTVSERARTARPKAHIQGVHLQRQVSEGQEVILGVVRDPQFGALVMFGSGGVEVEGLKDVAFALAPLTPVEAESLIGRTWAGKKLDGFRNIPPADKAAAVDVLARLAALAYDQPAITEIEINPLRVLKQGAVAVDVRIKC
jgi:acetyl coenzyme A synthetase (ADP forming)-like protein